MHTSLEEVNGLATSFGSALKLMVYHYVLEGVGVSLPHTPWCGTEKNEQFFVP